MIWQSQYKFLINEFPIKKSVDSNLFVISLPTQKNAYMLRHACHFGNMTDKNLSSHLLGLDLHLMLATDITLNWPKCVNKVHS